MNERVFIGFYSTDGRDKVEFYCAKEGESDERVIEFFENNEYVCRDEFKTLQMVIPFDRNSCLINNDYL